jgi:hypothetical protein
MIDLKKNREFVGLTKKERRIKAKEWIRNFEEDRIVKPIQKLLA